MIRLIQILVVGFLIYMIIRLVRLIRKFGSSSRPSIDDLKEQTKKFEKDSANIEDAEFREISPEEKKDSSEDING